MSPADDYAERLSRCERAGEAVERTHGRLGTIRLVSAAVFLLLAYVCAVRRTLSPAWLFLPIFIFIAALAYHQGVRRRRSILHRTVQFYRAGIERLQGLGRVVGATGARFIDPHHVYAADLDLFGERSLYQRLCAARTPMGEDTLAKWLLAPAAVPTIRERQAGITELRGRPQFREDLAVLGETALIELKPEAVAAWAESPSQLGGSWARAAAFILPVLALAGVLMWTMAGIASLFLAVLAVESVVNYLLRQRIAHSVEGIESAHEDLRLIAHLLGRIETEHFDAPILRDIQRGMMAGARRASQAMSSLATLVNFVEARRNPFLTPLLLPLLYTLHAALAAERWKRRHGSAVGSWLIALGHMEALLSLAVYSFERPADVFAELIEHETSPGKVQAAGALFCASALGHPLLPAETCVRNDIEMGRTARLLLISGSNMSGKSTLLRAVGINAVLAMAGAPVCARRLELSPLWVGASIRVNDSLEEGHSRFYAEILRLKQLFEGRPLPLLFLLDELLQGTNSIDRRAGARGIVCALLARSSIGCISTHDLALAEGVSAVAGDALRNVHFQDEFIDGKLQFDFTLRPGVVTRSNGLELMRAIGLDV